MICIKSPFGWMSGKVGDGKVGGYKRFDFSSCVFGWKGGKVGEWKTFLFS